MLTDDMKRVVSEQRLGFVATVNGDGAPNLSPKATFVVLDETRLAFCDLRSPGTLRNFASNPSLEVNFVDPFVARATASPGRRRLSRAVRKASRNSSPHSPSSAPSPIERAPSS
jgi:hypothetical protein